MRSCSTRSSPITSAIISTPRPRRVSRSRLRQPWSAAAAVGIGIVIAMIRTKSGLSSFDLRFARFGAEHATTWSTDVMRTISQLGGTTGVVVIALIATVVEFVRRPSRSIPLFMALVVGGQFALSNGIKYLVERARPDLSRLTGFAGSSFPSGHSTAASATLAAVALLTTRHRSRRTKITGASIAAGAAVLVAMTRVFLGVHWFTDVIAGLLLGWGWFALCSIAFGGRLLTFGQPVEAAEHIAEVIPASNEACGSFVYGLTSEVGHNGPMSIVVDQPAEHVLTIGINRPAARNAIDGPTARALAEEFRAFDDDPDMNVAVLYGLDGVFCAGADLKQIGSGNGNRVEIDMSKDGPLGPTRMLLSKPVIAAVEGYAVAGGLELALWCDMRVAAADAVFGVYCRRWGVPLVDGGTVRLPRLIGHSHALDMILTGRGVSGEEAMRMGLANRMVAHGAALDAAVALATEIAALPQRCLRSDRRSSFDQWGLTFDEAMSNETELGLATIRSGETREGAARFAAGEGRHGA